MLCLKDFEKYANENLPLQTWNFYATGAEREDTLKDNEEAFRRYKFMPRMLRNKVDINVSTTILGEKISFPVGFAPTAMQKLSHPDGEVAAARAAAEMNTVYALSIHSTTSMEDVANSSTGIRWFQVYIPKDENALKKMIKEAEENGYKALVLTVDLPVNGLRLVCERTRFSLPLHLKMPLISEALTGSDDTVRCTEGVWMDKITWEHVKQLKSLSKLPVVLKGILTAEDAKLAVEYGASAVWVSNHGGRQLDGTLATIDALQPIVQALKGTRCEVYVDGGVRWGSDVLKALALGARAVFIGRPLIWGLAHSGEDGARRILQILKDELILAMKLSGCQDLSEVGPSLLYNSMKSLL